MAAVLTAAVLRHGEGQEVCVRERAGYVLCRGQVILLDQEEPTRSTNNPGERRNLHCLKECSSDSRVYSTIMKLGDSRDGF